jgi:hypothetical protein
MTLPTVVLALTAWLLASCAAQPEQLEPIPNYEETYGPTECPGDALDPGFVKGPCPDRYF